MYICMRQTSYKGKSHTRREFKYQKERREFKYQKECLTHRETLYTKRSYNVERGLRWQEFIYIYTGAIHGDT